MIDKGQLGKVLLDFWKGHTTWGIETEVQGSIVKAIIKNAGGKIIVTAHSKASGSASGELENAEREAIAIAISYLPEKSPRDD